MKDKDTKYTKDYNDFENDIDSNFENEIALGRLINHIRIDKDISLEKLCAGICERSYLWECTKGDKNPNKPITSILLQRLGMDEYEHEDYLCYSEYKKFMEQKHIFNLLENGRILEAKEEIRQYKNSDYIKDRFDKRFLLIAKAGLMILEKQDNAKVAELLKQAIKKTVPNFLKVHLNMFLLGTDELFLILEYARLKPEHCGNISSHTIYEQVISYLDKWKCNDLVKVKLYPKAVCLANKKYLENKQYEKVLNNCNTAIKYIQKRGKHYFLIEVLEDKAKALEGIIIGYDNTKNITKKNDLKRNLLDTNEQIKTFREIYYKYNSEKIFLNWYVFTHTMEIYSTEDVIKTRREMLSITKKDLSEGICAPYTLVRIEKNNSTTHPRIAKKLLSKLNLSGNLHNSCILSSNYEAHKKRAEIDKLLILHRYSEAYEALKQLGEKIDLTLNINKQYYKKSETIILNKTGKISKSEALELFKSALELTVPEKAIFKEGKKHFSKAELMIMTNIANLYEEIGDIQNSYKWYENLENYYKSTNYDISNSIITYELIMCKYENFLGNNANYEKSIKIIEETLSLLLRYNRGWFIANNLYSLAWNKMKQITVGRELTQKEKESYIAELYKIRVVAIMMNQEVLKLFFESKIQEYV